MVYFVLDPKYTLHQTGMGHPEQPSRVTAINAALEQLQLKTPSNTLTPRPATEDEILLCHSKSYLKIVQDEVNVLKTSHTLAYLSTGDVVICELSYDVALLAAGGVLTAIDHVMTHDGTQVFCAVRPPGHHACTGVGMGFCLFNNVAIGARYAQQKYGIKRVTIVDWDVHHGNGTQEIFYSDPSVFYFSTHEKGLYPMTGAEDEIGLGEGEGFTMNCPIVPSPHSRVEVLEAFEKFGERMKEFKPELIMISAGFDAHESDPLGHFNLTDQDFYILSRKVKEIAEKHCQGRVISVLEGGYNLRALASASVAHVKGLL